MTRNKNVRYTNNEYSGIIIEGINKEMEAVDAVLTGTNCKIYKGIDSWGEDALSGRRNRSALLKQLPFNTSAWCFFDYPWHLMRM